MPRLKLTRKEQLVHRCTGVDCTNAHRPHYHETSVELIVQRRLSDLHSKLIALATSVDYNTESGEHRTTQVVLLSDIDALIEYASEL